MSHQDYIAECDEDQLESLIDLAKARAKAIKESGWVTLWVVSDDWCNRFWFAEDQHQEAFAKMIELAHADYKPGQNINWNVQKTRARPDEAVEMLRLNVPMEKP